MIRGKTKSGFEFSISEDAFNDYELLELFFKANENKIFVVPLAEKFLGADQKNALMEHLRRPDGKVPIDGMMSALSEIEDAISEKTNALKNSEPSPT